MAKNNSGRNGKKTVHVQLKSKKNGVLEENQNQQHNTQKEALGPNTRR